VAHGVQLEPNAIELFRARMRQRRDEHSRRGGTQCLDELASFHHMIHVARTVGNVNHSSVMTNISRSIITLALIGAAMMPRGACAQADDRLRTDWAYLEKYRKDNAALPPSSGDRVVFMGNSITEGWAPLFPTLFPGKPYISRGISGQTTPQMLVRFRQDVVALKPKVVVILAGTNDIAGNTGPSTIEMIEDNLMSMTEIAKANNIRVVLSAVLPVDDYPWKRGLDPSPKIMTLNAWMKRYAVEHGAVFLDYHSAMQDERHALRHSLTYDGVHPNEAGYRVMAPLAERAIAEALR
jgi:lysophospholipase L1-like esterase